MVALTPYCSVGTEVSRIIVKNRVCHDTQWAEVNKVSTNPRLNEDTGAARDKQWPLSIRIEIRKRACFCWPTLSKEALLWEEFEGGRGDTSCVSLVIFINESLENNTEILSKFFRDKIVGFCWNSQRATRIKLLMKLRPSQMRSLNQWLNMQI